MRVLVVDNEPLLGHVLRKSLRERGDDAVVVATAEAALEIVAREPPELILVDIKLPGMSGLDFMRDRLVRESGIPTIVMSGVAMETEARQALAEGAIDVVPKPIALDHLIDVLEAIAPFAPARADLTPAKRDRRPARRTRVSLELEVVQGPRVSRGTCVEVSATGMKARVHEPPRPGSTVRLTFPLPDSRMPLDVLALVIRIDADGTAFKFRDLAAGAAARIDRLVAVR